MSLAFETRDLDLERVKTTSTLNVELRTESKNATAVCTGED